jgi:hypothetical protein
MIRSWKHVVIQFADWSGYRDFPGADLLSICESQYEFIQGPWPTALVYSALLSSTAAHIGNVLELLRVTMCGHLQNEQFKDTSMGHLTTIALALRSEILIPCDELEVAGQGICDVVYGNVPYQVATLQRLLLNSDSTKISAPWSIEVCLSNCESKVSIVGCLQSLVASILYSPATWTAIPFSILHCRRPYSRLLTHREFDIVDYLFSVHPNRSDLLLLSFWRVWAIGLITSLSYLISYNLGASPAASCHVALVTPALDWRVSHSSHHGNEAKWTSKA